MPIVLADWSADDGTGNVRYIGNDHGGGAPSYASVLEFRRHFGDKSDDATFVGDDEADITIPRYCRRITDNIIQMVGNRNIDDNAAEHLYDGSIIQGTGGTEVIYDGIVNFGNADVQIQIHQNGAVLVDDWWNFSGAGLNADAVQGISHRFMIKVRDAGADIDGRALIGTSRTLGRPNREFSINATGRGNNVLALNNAGLDLNNQTLEATIAGWTNIVNNNEGYIGIDVDNNGADEFYYSNWDRDTQTINDFYERLKWLQRDGTASTVYGLNGELFRGITHEIDVDTPTGTFNAFEPVSWTGGTGQMLAIDSTTAATKMWIQLLTGSVPGDNVTITGGTSSATVDVNVTVTSRPISATWPGQSTGTALIGSYGLGVEATDLTSSDSLTDLTNTVVNPPNFVTFSAFGNTVAETRLLVGPWDGVAVDTNGDPEIDYDQLLLNTTLNGAAETAVVTTVAIPTDTPSTGDIRITLDNGQRLEITYTSFTGSTFTIPSTDFSVNNATAGNGVWIAYIDKLATSVTETFTGVFSSTRDLVVVARDGGGTPVDEFITTAQLTSTGGSATLILSSDA